MSSPLEFTLSLHNATEQSGASESAGETTISEIDVKKYNHVVITVTSGSFTALRYTPDSNNQVSVISGHIYDIASVSLLSIFAKLEIPRGSGYEKRCSANVKIY